MRRRRRLLAYTGVALALVAITGYAGHLQSIRPLDRLLNPHARNYWESERHYHRAIYDFCTNQAARVLDTAGEQVASRSFAGCYDRSLEKAIERGDVTLNGLQDLERDGGFAD